MTARLGPRELVEYRRARAAGAGVQEAVRTVRYARDVRQFEAQFQYGRDGLELHDSDDVLRWVVEWLIDFDMGTPSENGDCYEDADEKAWADEKWHYYLVKVTYYATPEDTGTAYLGGIDAGEYWNRPTYPLDTDQQVLAAVMEHDLLDEARADALRGLQRQHVPFI